MYHCVGATLTLLFGAQRSHLNLALWRPKFKVAKISSLSLRSGLAGLDSHS